MNRTCIAQAIVVLIVPSSLLLAAPTVSVVPLGINPSGNREWSVRVQPDFALYYNPSDFADRGVGGSLAVELAFSVVGSGLEDADANTAMWTHANPGYNPFTSSYASGLAVSGGGGGTSIIGGGAFVGLLGDYNDNGVVDTADYTVWQDHLGGNFFLPNELATPGVVTVEDYDTWASNFGNTAAASPGGGGSTQTIFAAFGSSFLTGFSSVELLSIETLGDGPTTIKWGSLAGAPYLGGSRVAQAGANFDGRNGTITVPEPAAIALVLIAFSTIPAMLLRWRRSAHSSA
jgi:hypothetical protein